MARETSVAQGATTPTNAISARTRQFAPSVRSTPGWDEAARTVQAIGRRGQALKQQVRRSYPIDGDNEEYNRRIARINRVVNNMNRRILGY